MFSTTFSFTAMWHQRNVVFFFFLLTFSMRCTWNPRNGSISCYQPQVALIMTTVAVHSCAYLECLHVPLNTTYICVNWTWPVSYSLTLTPPKRVFGSKNRWRWIPPACKKPETISPSCRPGFWPTWLCLSAKWREKWVMKRDRAEKEAV